MGFDQIQVEIQDAWGDDRTAAYDAWGSTTLEEKIFNKTDEDVEKLITERLVPPWHATPFEGIWFRIYVKLPIFIERQYDKYRMMIQDQDIEVEYLRGPMGRDLISQNELSGRYRSIPSEYYWVPEDIKDITHKVFDGNKAYNQGVYQHNYHHMMKQQIAFYEENIAKMKEAQQNGVITNQEYKRWREVHRGVLGTGFFTYMRLRANLVALMHMWQQRLKSEAQPEAQDIAQKILKGVWDYGNIPITMQAIVKKFGWEQYIE